MVVEEAKDVLGVVPDTRENNDFAFLTLERVNRVDFEVIEVEAEVFKILAPELM